MGKGLVNYQDLMGHFKNVVIAVEQYKGTKLEHINLDKALSEINKVLFEEDAPQKPIDDINSSVN